MPRGTVPCYKAITCVGLIERRVRTVLDVEMCRISLHLFLGVTVDLKRDPFGVRNGTVAVDEVESVRLQSF